MGRSHSFNAVHGRMPSVATGAALANHRLLALGVSGDGDTASIGIGQFVHLMRRNLPMIYIIENNGVYGLTKGQFSATADVGSKLKTGVVNELPPIDTCLLAIELGATFVGRSFSGDKKQLQTMLKAAIAHRGTVMLDVISPCVTFNDHEGSTKSYKFMKDHEEPLTDADFVPAFARDRRGVRSRHKRRRHHARRLSPAAAQAGRRLQSDGQSYGRAAPDAGQGGQRGAHRNLLREHRAAELHRPVELDFRSAGDAADRARAASTPSAGEIMEELK